MVRRVWYDVSLPIQPGAGQTTSYDPDRGTLNMAFRDPGGRSSPSGLLGWVGQVFQQVYSDRQLIPPGKYVAYNAFIGIILAGGAVLVALEPRLGSSRTAASLGVTGILLLAGIPVALLRPSIATRLLALHGAVLVGLAVALTAGSISWALRAPPHAPFRYAPGAGLVLLVYGMLQVAAFGPWPERAKRLRMVGLILGLGCEATVVVFLILRASRL